jgi:hypothetical protein
LRHLKKIIGIGSLLVLSAAVALPVAAVNANYEQQADAMRTSTAEWVNNENTVNADTKMNAISTNLKLTGNLEYVSLAEAVKHELDNAKPFPGLFSNLPGAKAMIEATEAYDTAAKRGIDNKVTAKMKSIKEAKHLCELLDSGDLIAVASAPENREFFSSPNMSSNLPYYLEYCGVTGTPAKTA